MNINKKLRKLGIFPEEELKIEEKISITKAITEKISNNIQELDSSYNELYMRIYNCKIYYAQIDNTFNGVFYYYKNNAIYIDKNRDITKIDECIIHEVIHYLQKFSKVDNKKETRAGVCKFSGFKIIGLGINEALVQYITSKAMDTKIQKINNKEISISTNSPYYYKYMTSLIYQLLFLTGEKEAIISCINSTEEFEEKLYDIFEENTEKILKNFDLILNENNKKNRNEEKIIKLYMETQEIIYNTYFINMCKRVNTISEIDIEVQKLEEYQEIVGKILNKPIDEDKFYTFKIEMNSKFLKKYMEVYKSQNNKSLTIIYKNTIYNLMNKISNFIQSKFQKNKLE